MRALSFPFSSFVSLVYEYQHPSFFLFVLNTRLSLRHCSAAGLPKGSPQRPSASGDSTGTELSFDGDVHAVVTVSELLEGSCDQVRGALVAAYSTIWHILFVASLL